MAARYSSPETDFSCSVCREIFNDPVVLSCSHSFCKDCLLHWWAETQDQLCPLCKRRSSKADPPCNLALRNLCEAFLQRRALDGSSEDSSEDVCSLHAEKLKLFCLDHQAPMCVVCRDSKTHKDHRCAPIEEAAPDYRKKLVDHLKPLVEELEHLNQVAVNWNTIATRIEEQADITKGLIKQQFKKLHNFLKEEEAARITAVSEEEKNKSEMMKDKIEALSREIADLSDTIRLTKEDLRAGNVSFLQNYKASVGRVQQRPLLDDPELGPGPNIDLAKHLGNLAFNIWGKMKDMVTYSPVVLDPNTAERHLTLTADLTAAVYDANVSNPHPELPERFEDFPTVLGSEGFSSGTHSWDVEVGGSTDWSVGVIAQSAPRSSALQTGYWAIWFHDGKYRAFSPTVTDKVLSVKKKLQKIRVHLNCNSRKVTFSDPDTDSNIYSSSNTFPESLFPFINTVDAEPLWISPVKVTVQLDTVAETAPCTGLQYVLQHFYG